ncbi:WD repeat protein iqw1 [Neolecta irregularis DAH-3]|uniref:WD repeat protein iqw1 n=1 Tax=Neolecta irregularis (strain DAH-3) TaxID=1198029 RepID=A0A1U7LQ78_NEOID|nr:WD repeat protein iqw1 [Neolecta irregularis DAH-3]|eukprot:OLL24778.1 WD repeat protein iqw1 [Neolecta irregularis DAH-3]
MIDKEIFSRQLSGSHAKSFKKSLYGSKAWVEKLDIQSELKGHLGCVNALTLVWSKDGDLLASGSDDKRIIIWSTEQEYRKTKVIHTAHSANIFSVKFMPHTSNSTIVSAAGDHQIRVFDVDYTDGTKRIYQPDAVRHTYTGFQDRAKRIVTEDSPHCFLACSEDGTVRYFDLRQDGNSGTVLIDYSKNRFEIHSLSMSIHQPQYLIIGGTSSYVLLHDRRMLGRRLQQEWGQLPLVNQSTQCVRRFCPSGRETSARRSPHITACKFSDEKPNQFLGSWSAEDIYLFDMHKSPEEKVVKNFSSSSKIKTVNGTSPKKRKRSNELQDPPESNRDQFLRSTTVTPPPRLQRLAKQLVLIRREFFRMSPTEDNLHNAANQAECLVEAMVYSLENNTTLNPEYSLQRSMALRFVKAVGAVAYVSTDNVEGEAEVEGSDTIQHCVLESNWEWPYNVVFYIVEYLSSHSPDIPEIPPRNPDSPITHPDDFSHQIFPSISSMISALRSAVQLPLSSTARTFWVNVARSLLLIEGEGIEFDFVNIAWNERGSESFGDSEEEYNIPSSDEDHEEDSDDNRNNNTNNIEKDIPVVSHIRGYKGHANTQTVKDVNFYGLRDEYVVSGSDCGNLFIWDRDTSKIVQILQGDDDVVNVVEGHPSHPTLAVSGIDNTVKIFSPNPKPEHIASRQRVVDEYKIIARNEMTKQQGLQDTISARTLMQAIAARMGDRRIVDSDGEEHTADECQIM